MNSAQEIDVRIELYSETGAEVLERVADNFAYWLLNVRALSSGIDTSREQAVFMRSR